MAEETLVAPVTTEAASAPADVETTATETDSPEEVESDTPAEEESSATEQTDETESTEDSPEEPKEIELSEFTGSAGARLRELCKAAPGMDKLLAQYPKVKDQIALSFRRDAALRDLNATVAEIREYRERLPNGLQDLKHIEQEVQELGQIDNAFYNKQGGQLIKHMFEADSSAAISLFKEMPLQWSKLDPESYNETFRAIIDSTFRQDRIADTALRAYRRAEQKGDKDGMEDAAALYNYLSGFGKQDVEETPREKAFREEKEAFENKQKTDAGKAYETYKNTFLSESEKFQRDVVSNSPLFKKLPQSIPAAKKLRIVDEVRSLVRQHLTKSRAFMSQLEAAHNARDPHKALEVQKGQQGWQPWLVGMYSRKVLDAEVPGLIEGNNAANRVKRAAAARTGIANRAPSKPQTPAGKTAPRTRPDQFTDEELFAPDFDQKHPGVLDAYLSKRNRR